MKLFPLTLEVDIDFLLRTCHDTSEQTVQKLTEELALAFQGELNDIDFAAMARELLNEHFRRNQKAENERS